MATPKKSANKFEELRNRAIESGIVHQNKTTDEPFILGEDWGFKESPISVEKPTFTRAELISEALRTSQVMAALRLIFGEDLRRISPKLDALGDDAGPAAIMLIEDVMVHFYGKGAAQVFPR
ncbi:hypothetical protein AALI21_02740 [Corynebacteriaceae bacterium 6-324]